MSQFLEQVMGGEARGVGTSLLRGALRIAEVPYSAAVTLRNRLFDGHLRRSHRLLVPVVSVGNITAGGTGKTPVVQWLARKLVESGKKPAILLRGYKRQPGQESDEELLLRESTSALVHAQADRVAGGQKVLAENPATDIVILDDGFQHRRLQRDFDLVLIDATNPFGYGHVHPRGLLREPLGGLRRADAIVLTRSDQIAPEMRSQIEATLRGYNPRAPVYRARHAITGFRTSDEAAADLNLDAIAGQVFFLAAGIGNPKSLLRQVEAFPAPLCGHRLFPDHHPYSQADVEHLCLEAANAGAKLLLTTEKDWTKLRPLASAASLPIWRLKLEVQFDPRAERGLLDLIETRIEKSRGGSSAT